VSQGEGREKIVEALESLGLYPPQADQLLIVDVPNEQSL